jgi:23S rRNA (uridine2552-2'-O)-methyltransferase
MSKPPQPGGRMQETRVKTARSRSASSTRWLARQLNDPYVVAAKSSGYRSRAAWKLVELDDKHKFLKRGRRVLDLGAAPGGWSQVAAARAGEGHVLAVDINDMAPIPGVTFLKLDFLAEDAEQQVRDALGGPVDVVLSDMAAPSTGHRPTDHIRIMGLVETAYAFASQILAPGGVFLAKVLQGGTERALLDRLKRDFAQVRHVKPPASRADSTELYVLALGFRAA